MKIKKKSKVNRIIEAAIMDGINYIIGCSRVPVPSEIVKEVITIKKEGAPPHFEVGQWTCFSLLKPVFLRNRL